MPNVFSFLILFLGTKAVTSSVKCLTPSIAQRRVGAQVVNFHAIQNTPCGKGNWDSCIYSIPIPIHTLNIACAVTEDHFEQDMCHHTHIQNNIISTNNEVYIETPTLTNPYEDQNGYTGLSNCYYHRFLYLIKIC